MRPATRPASGAPDPGPAGDPGPGPPLAAEPRPEAAAPAARRGGAAAVLVALGILVTRLFGLVRTRVTAQYLGAGDAADAFTAATRIPNFLQNLFGEGVLSASFIPVYARLLARGDRREADRLAGAVFGLLAAAVTALVALGVLATPAVVDAVADGFAGEKRALTISLVRVLFPGVGLLVLSAWCLGVLNSHGRFFLSYAAPVLWNVAIVAAIVWGGVTGLRDGRLATVAAYGTVAGCALQLLVQLPPVLAALGRFRPSFGRGSPHAREVVRNFGPVFVARGAVQISGYVDLAYASYLGSGAAAALGYAQQLYLLPVALFGMSVSAAQLPAMAGTLGDTVAVHASLRRRLSENLRRIAYLVVPSAAAFLALGDVVAAFLLQSGAFRRADSVYVWGVLAGSAVGLLASTMGRLYASAFYALGDTRAPLRYALVRIALTVGLGWLLAFPAPRLLGVAPRWGVAGLTVSAGIAGWAEFGLLRAGLAARIGVVPTSRGHLVRVWAAAAAAAGAGWALKLLVGGALGVRRPLVDGAIVLGGFGLTYLVGTLALGVPEARTVLGRVAARVLPGRSGASRTRPEPPGTTVR